MYFEKLHIPIPKEVTFPIEYRSFSLVIINCFEDLNFIQKNGCK